jgi:MerR family copper efflux transcriptional regulator
MRIGELARRTGLTTKTLRFYEQAGVLARPARGPSGDRDYDETALTRLRFVRAAQSAGLTLTEVRDIIAIRDNNGAPCSHVVAVLDRHLDDLQVRIKELTAMRNEVRGLRERANTLDPANCSDDDICHVIPSQHVS